MLPIRRAPLAHHVGALCIYLLLAIALTWPLASRPGSLLIGGYESRGFTFEDGSQNIWNIWWVGHALAEGKHPFWSDMLYYPEGLQFYFQTLNLAGIVPVLPIHYAWGPVAAYTCALWLALTLTGYAGFLLTRAFVPGWFIPLFAGFLLTASPFHLMKLRGNHVNLLSMQWMVLYVLGLMWLTQRRDKRSALLLAFSALMVALNDWYWVLACAFFTLAWFAYSLWHDSDRQGQLRAYGRFVGYTLILATPLLVGIWGIRERLQLVPVAGDQWWRVENEHFAADALGLFFPALWPWLEGEQQQALLKALTPHTPPQYTPEAWYVGAGWLLLALAAVGMWHAGQQRWRWLFVGGCMWLLALGPTLTVAGFKLGIPMPYALLQELPFLTVARRPSHFAALCIVVAMIFAALGLQHISQSRTRLQRGFLYTGLIALAVIELWPTGWLHYEFQVDPLFAHIRNKPGVVVDLPYEELWTSRSLRNQTVHEQPILGGYVARRPPYPTFYSNPLFSQLALMKPWPDDIIPLDPPTLQAMQCYYRLRHVVVALDETEAAQLSKLTTMLTTLTGTTLQPTYNDGSYLAYELPFFADACRAFLLLDRGWFERETDGVRIWRWTGAETQFWVINPFAQPRPMRLSMAIDGRYPVYSELWRSHELLARWEIQPTRRDYELLLVVPPGATQFTIHSTTIAEPGTPRQIAFPLVALHIEE